MKVRHSSLQMISCLNCTKTKLLKKDINPLWKSIIPNHWLRLLALSEGAPTKANYWEDQVAKTNNYQDSIKQSRKEDEKV